MTSPQTPKSTRICVLGKRSRHTSRTISNSWCSSAAVQTVFFFLSQNCIKKHHSLVKRLAGQMEQFRKTATKQASHIKAVKMMKDLHWVLYSIFAASYTRLECKDNAINCIGHSCHGSEHFIHWLYWKLRALFWFHFLGFISRGDFLLWR